MDNFMSPQQFYNYRFTRFMGMAGGLTNALTSQPTWSMAGGFDQMAIRADATSDDYRLKTFLQNGMTTDWAQIVLQQGFQQNHYIAVNGSSAVSVILANTSSSIFANISSFVSSFMRLCFYLC